MVPWVGTDRAILIESRVVVCVSPKDTGEPI